MRPDDEVSKSTKQTRQRERAYWNLAEDDFHAWREQYPIRAALKNSGKYTAEAVMNPPYWFEIRAYRARTLVPPEGCPLNALPLTHEMREHAAEVARASAEKARCRRRDGTEARSRSGRDVRVSGNGLGGPA